MRVSVTEAKGQLTDLVRRAEAGDEVILTGHGQEVVRLVQMRPKVDLDARRKAIQKARALAQSALPGPDAAHSQDYLYDEFGLPK